MLVANIIDHNYWRRNIEFEKGATVIIKSILNW